MIKKAIVADNTFFTVITFSRINSFTLNQFYRNTARIRPIYQKNNRNLFQKDSHQDNLSLACLQFFKHNCLNVPAGYICFHK